MPIACGAAVASVDKLLAHICIVCVNEAEVVAQFMTESRAIEELVATNEDVAGMWRDAREAPGSTVRVDIDIDGIPDPLLLERCRKRRPIVVVDVTEGIVILDRVGLA